MNNQFRLTSQHIKLLQNAYVSWDDCEFGAPCIDPKRPYGNSDVFQDLSDLLGMPYRSEADDCDDEEAALLVIHKETKTALQVVLASGSFEPGLYEACPYEIDWRRVGD